MDDRDRDTTYDPERTSSGGALRWIVGGLIVAAVLVGAAFLITGLIGTGGGLNLAYLPPDSELVVQMRVADLWEAPLFESATKQFPAQMASSMLAGTTGVKLDEVESVMFGVAGISEIAELAQPGAPPDPASLAKLRAVGVIRTTTDMNVEQITTQLGAGNAREYGGAKYFAFEGGAMPGMPAAALYFPNNRTAVAGTEAEVKAAIDSGGRRTDNPRFEFVDGGHHLLLAFAPKDPSAFATRMQELTPPGAEEFAKPLDEETAKNVEAGAFGLNVTDGLSFHLQVDCKDPATAAKLKQQYEQVLVTLREQLAQNLDKVPEQGRKVASLFQRALEDARVSESETVVELAVVVDGELKEAVETAGGFDALSPLGLAGGDAIGGDGGFEIERDVPELPEAVSLDTFNDAWQVDLEAQNRPAARVLEDLALEAGLSLEITGDVREPLATPVTISLPGVSHLQAFETVCREAGVTPVYEESGDVRLRPGPRELPVAFAGPFVIEIVELTQNPQYATGRLTVRALAAGIPESVRAAVADRSDRLLSVQVSGGAENESLLDPHAGTTWFPEEGKLLSSRQQVGLKNLLKNVETLSTVSGRVTLPVPTAVEELTFDTLSAGTMKSSGDVSVTLTEAQSGLQTTLTFRYEGVSYDDIVFQPRDAAGEPFGPLSVSGGGGDKNGTTTLFLDKQAASVVAVAVVGKEELSYEFEIRDVPLPDHAQMPERLEEASFEGHPAPVTVEFVSLQRDDNFPKVQLRAVNHSNKDVRQIEMKFEYLDAAGKTLKDWPANWSGDGTASDEAAALPAGKSADIETTAFFLPEEAKSVRPVVQRIIFADASEWAPPAAGDGN
ncbi:MAG: hypothetical protein KY476_03190 [Planctomycetes bacterium]|nr:hypothetical protein [Planctomycetota bacterium]